MTNEFRRAMLNAGGLREAIADPWVALTFDIVASCAAVARVFASARCGQRWAQDGGPDPLGGVFACAIARNEGDAIALCLQEIEQELQSAPSAAFQALAKSEDFLAAEMFLTQGCGGLESNSELWNKTRGVINARWAMLVMAVNEAAMAREAKA